MRIMSCEADQRLAFSYLGLPEPNRRPRIGIAGRGDLPGFCHRGVSELDLLSWGR